MAVYTVLDRRTAANLIGTYGLGRLAKLTGISTGSVNTHYLLETTRGKFFLKVDEVKDLNAAQQELELLLFLRAHRFCCPQPVIDRQGRYHQTYRGKPVSLYHPLIGKALSEEQLTATQLEQTGRALASLHALSSGYPKEDNNRFDFACIATLYQEVREKLPGYFRHLTHTLDDEIAYQQQYQEDKLPKGIVHGDLFADNLLFRGEKIVGILDFEAAGHGKFIYDLATAVNALCYSEGRYIIERFASLLVGYQSCRTLPLAEWDAFPNELRFSALRFTVTRLKDFFLRPMSDDVRVNKDFREFFERLQILRRERPGGMDRLLLAMATGYDYRQYQRPSPPQEKTEGRKRTESKRTGGRQCLSPLERRMVNSRRCSIR